MILDLTQKPAKKKKNVSREFLSPFNTPLSGKYFDWKVFSLLPSGVTLPGSCQSLACYDIDVFVIRTNQTWHICGNFPEVV